ncbi:MAG: twin-arginine translocation signal domain-containing protein [candidate division KSB1 bacterium]
MSEITRRDFLKHASLGLATLGATSLTLRSEAKPTAASSNIALSEHVLQQMGEPPIPLVLQDKLKPTAQNPLGPFYRAGAPFRAKVTPPFEPGTALLVSGRVWAYDTKKPLAGAVLDVWHVDHTGVYSSGDPDAKRGFKNRARLITSETGYYEFEAIHPIAYQPNSDFWRSPHIHYKITHPGYKTLVTELFFEGDDKHDVDPMFQAGLMMKIVQQQANGHTYESTIFDIVLEAGSGMQGD